MTSTRLARGTKGRVLLYLCAIIIVTGIIALYHTTQSQLEDVRKSSDLCHQQQESLSTQLQVIFEYKQRLEKSLQSEKTEHKQTKSELEAKINDEKSRRNKTSMEATLRFTSLQQHYKLLQSQHEDFKEESGRIQQQQLNEINNLQAKYKELQEQLKKSMTDKDNSLEHLKTQYLQLQQSKDDMQKRIKENQGNTANSENEVHRLTKENHQLQREIDQYKEKCNIHENQHVYPQNLRTSQKPSSTTVFSKQVDTGDHHYQIRDSQDKPLEKHIQDNQLNNPNNMPESNMFPQHVFKNSDNVLAMPPNDENNADNNNQHEFKESAHVLPLPNMEKAKVSTPKSSTKASFKVSKASLDGAKPLLQPSVTTSSTKAQFMSPKSNDVMNEDMKNALLPASIVARKKLPEGVVRAPEMHPNNEEPKLDKNDETKNIPDEINDALPNRYRNNIIDSEMQHISKGKEPAVGVAENDKLQNPLEFNLGVDLNQENSAAEVVDAAAKLQEDPFNIMDTNNLEAPADTNKIVIKDIKNVPMMRRADAAGRKYKKQHIDDLKMGEAKLNGGEALGGAGYNDEPDYDKDAQRGEDLQLEEAEAEGGEDDDPDDYEGHVAARQKEPAS